MKSKKIVLKKSVKSLFLIIIIISFCSGLGIIVFDTVNDIIVKSNEREELNKTILALQKDEKYLNNEIKRLEDSEYLARYAREKYFYSKDGELIIRIPDNFS